MGYFLHLLALPIGWLFWFPIAFGFMRIVYQQTKNASAVFCTALVASSIKLSDLLMPVRIDYVINPAVSIILEALAVLVVYKIFVTRKEEGKRIFSYSGVAMISVLWRAFYLIYVHFLPRKFFVISPAAGIQPLLKFLVIENVANILMICFVSKVGAKIRKSFNFWNFTPYPTLSLTTLLLAFLLQWKF